MSFGQQRAGESKAKLKEYRARFILVMGESQAQCKAEGESVCPWRGGGALDAALGACGQKSSSSSRSFPCSPERLMLPLIAWTNSCERASSFPLVSCNYCPSVLLERDHLLLLHHHSSSHLPGEALSLGDMAHRADGASPEVPHCSLCSIRSKAAAPSADTSLALRGLPGPSVSYRTHWPRNEKPGWCCSLRASGADDM